MRSNSASTAEITTTHDNVSTAPATNPRIASGTILVLIFGLLVIVVSLYFILGMPGMDHSPSQPHDMNNMRGTINTGLRSTGSDAGGLDASV